MTFYLLYLFIIIFSVLNFKIANKYRYKIQNFICNDYYKLCEKMNMNINQVLDVNFFVRKTIFDFIPIVNVLLSKQKLADLKWEFNELKNYIYKENPVFEYQDKIEVANKDRIYKNDTIYFIGYFIGGSPKNYFFQFDGEEIVILDSSASVFKVLSNQENEYLLLYLLYAWYNGGNKFLNGSYNLNDVFNDKMVENLMHKFEGINIPENNFEIKMTRKRK